MKPPDIIIIVVLAVIVAAIVVFLVKRRKKGGCASCPYSKSCGTQGGCCPSQPIIKDNPSDTDNPKAEQDGNGKSNPEKR